MKTEPISNDAQVLPGLFLSAVKPGVTRRELWAWAMYDFANSGYTTVVITTVFSTYFVGVVAAGKTWGTLAFTAALSLSYLVVMLTMPSLGARADAKAAKRRLLFTSTVGCVAATWFLALVGPGDIALGVLVLAVSSYCYCVGESVVAAFLPEIARPEALGRVSGWGWGFGYFGGMLTLGLSLALVAWASGRGLAASEYVPYVMLLTGVIFAIAAIPSFVFLRERNLPTHRMADGWLQRLRNAWRETSEHFPDFRLLLICGAFYHAGIAVVVTLAAIYATEAMGFTMAQTMALVFAVNIGAAAGALTFGHLQDRIGHKKALSITLWGWIVMVLVGVHGLGERAPCGLDLVLAGVPLDAEHHIGVTHDYPPLSVLPAIIGGNVLTSSYATALTKCKDHPCRSKETSVHSPPSTVQARPRKLAIP